MKTKIGITKTFLFFLCFSTTTFAQYYDSGQDPFRLKWRQIKTDRFQLIYPTGFDSIAQIYLSNLESVANYEKGTLTYKPQRIPVVLHPNTIISNGEVGWAPKRMNLYLVAPQDNYFQPWEEQLPIHEFRHTVQLSKLNQYSLRWLNVALGEHATATILGWHLPLWFIEGDAVAFETGASHAGRGRVPDFQMKLNAQVIEKGIYSYPKALFGSYREFVPNRYELGYYLVAKGSYLYGDQLWNEALNKVSRSPLHPNPLSASLKTQTGFTEKEYYWQQLNNLVDSNKKPDLQKTHRDNKINDYVNYYNPVKINHSILAYKTSLSEIPAFVLIDADEKEQLVFEPGSVFDNSFSANDSLLVWNEFNPTRWDNENFARIAVYNLKRGKLHYINHKSRIFSSRLSVTGDTLVSVEVDEKLKWFITLRKTENGELLNQLSYDTLQPIQPNLSPNGNFVVFVAVGSHGKSLGIFDLSTHFTQWILKDQTMEFSNPRWSSRGILLKATFDGASNFFLYTPESKNWFLLTKAVYGVNEGTIFGDTLWYSAYTSDGFKIDSLIINEPSELFKQSPQEYDPELANHLKQMENIIPFKKPLVAYEFKKYSKFAHLINIHSWAPLAIKVENQEVGLGVTLLSQDVLSTSFLSLGYQNHRKDGYDEFFMEHQYKGFYPILNSKYSLIPLSYYHPDRDTILLFVEENRHFLTHSWQFPFYLNRSKWYRYIQPELSYQYAFFDMKPNPYFIEKDKMHKWATGLFIYNLQKQSTRDLYPRWGQLLYANFSKVWFGDFKGTQMVLYGRFYFPGLIKNHSLRFYGGYQTQEKESWPYYSKLLIPRGFTSFYSNEMVATRSEYTWPIIYPDLNIKEWLYIKRVRLNIFHDYAQYNQNFHQQSIGFELGFDVHALRLITPFDLSLRYVYRITDNTPFIEFNYSVNFNALYGKSVKKF